MDRAATRQPKGRGDGMILRQRNRARLSRDGCDCCNSNLATNSVKKYRRTVKRRERAAWKREY